MARKEIVPTILTKNFLEVQEKIAKVAGIAPRVQIDVVDGVFANNKTFSPEVLKELETSVSLDLHLMVQEPINWLEKSSAVMVDRVIGQIEMMGTIEAFLEKALGLGMKVGLALDLETPVERIAPEVYLHLDLVLVMAVKAGFGGQTFDPRALEKIKKIRAWAGETVLVGVDGGLTKTTIVECSQAGAEVFCLGKTFWTAEDLAQKYQELTQLVK